MGLTCGNCQLICHPDKEVRKARYKMLVESGVVVQNSDGSLEAVTPAEGKKRIAEMDPDTRALYEKISKTKSVPRVRIITAVYR